MALPKLYDLITWHNNTTPALNEDNLNAMSQAIDDIDDRLIDLAGTIMEDVPQIIEDMEILEPAIESIDENVARAEAAAESAEQYAEEIAPPIEVVKDYADIITIEDAINKPVKDLKVKVDPVQDLHGYTKPWVGGAGKNKLPLDLATIKSLNTGGTWSGNAYTLNNVTFTIQTDDAGNVIGIKAYGTASAQTTLNLTSDRVLDYNSYVGLKVTGCSNGSGSTYDIRIVYRSSTYGWLTSDSQTSSAVTIRSGVSNAVYVQFMIIVANSANINETLYPMASSDGGAFEPYSNICPITGHSEAKVTRAGKNLLEITRQSGTVSNVVITNNGDTLTLKGQANASNNPYVNDNVVLKNGSYVLSFGTSAVEARIYGWNGSWVQLGSGTGEVSFTASSDYTKYMVTMGISNGVNYDTIVKPMISVVGGTFEPYQGNTYTIDLDGTRYGVTLDVTSGVLTVLGTLDIIDESTTIGKDGNGFYTAKNDCKRLMDYSDAIICNALETVASPIELSDKAGITAYVHASSYAGQNWIYWNVPGISTTSDMSTWLETNNLQVVYPLATPTTVQLTPAEVELLLGYNTLFADTGDLSLTYDASGVLRIANAKLDTETLKTIVAASSDFADFKARIAAL